MLEEEEVKDDSSLWFPDSRTRTCITSNFGNMSLASPYEGGDNVQTTNGSSVEILHIGSSQFNCSNMILHIKDLSHLKSYYISIHKFYKDNDICF